MILSAEQLFSGNQAITATALSENVIDTGVRGTPYDAAAPLNGDIGKGNPIPVLIQVTEDFATLTTLTVTIETSDNENMTSSTALATQTIPVADLTAGLQTFIQFLPNGVTGRYLAVRYGVGGSNATAGRITAGISMGNQTNVTGA